MAVEGKALVGTQTAALISPNSRAILRQDAPTSSLMYTSPNRLNARMRLASAGCVARPHMVALGCEGVVGSPRSPQSPWCGARAPFHLSWSLHTRRRAPQDDQP